MDKFTTLTSTCVPLPIENVDTDQIIPARFLKATSREGFGKNLFRDWRYADDGSEKPDFVLNNPLYSGRIIVSGRNFGSGSSREHAAWALYDHGFRAVISSFFADIFKNNALNNGLLPAQVSETFLKNIFESIEKDSNSKISIDLEQQSLVIDSTRQMEKFDINSYKKLCLMNGYNDLDFLISKKAEISEFESNSIYLTK